MGLIYESNGTVRLDENSEQLAWKFAVAMLLQDESEKLKVILKKEYEKIFQYELASSKNTVIINNEELGRCKICDGRLDFIKEFNKCRCCMCGKKYFVKGLID